LEAAVAELKRTLRAA